MSLEDRIHEMFGAEPNMTELAKSIGLSRQALYAAFKRERDGKYHGIDTKTAMQIRRLSGRSMSWILTGEEDAARSPDIQLRAARRVAQGISKDLSIPLPVAREIVGRVALDESVVWADDLELYRIVRGVAGVPSVKAHSSTPKPKLLGVGQKITTRNER